MTSPAGPQTGGTDPQINQALVEGAATGRFSAEAVAFFRSRAPAPLVDRIRVPTLLLQGTVDTLFPLKEAMRNHAILKRNGVPVQMVWFCGGHGVCLTERGPEHRARASRGDLVRPLAQAQAGEDRPALPFFARGGKLTAAAPSRRCARARYPRPGSGTLAIAPSAEPAAAR